MRIRDKRQEIETLKKLYDWFWNNEPFKKALALKLEIEEAIEQYEALVASKNISSYRKYNGTFAKTVKKCPALRADIIYIKKEDLNQYISIIYDTEIFEKNLYLLEDTGEGDIDYFLRRGREILCDIKFAGSTKEKKPYGISVV